jgi:hypothetical protein
MPWQQAADGTNYYTLPPEAAGKPKDSPQMRIDKLYALLIDHLLLTTLDPGVTGAHYFRYDDTGPHVETSKGGR